MGSSQSTGAQTSYALCLLRVTVPVLLTIVLERVFKLDDPVEFNLFSLLDLRLLPGIICGKIVYLSFVSLKLVFQQNVSNKR